jgi:hypothetical protein
MSYETWWRRNNACLVTTRGLINPSDAEQSWLDNHEEVSFNLVTQKQRLFDNHERSHLP